MIILKTINEILALLLELAMFASIGYYSYTKGATPVFKWLIAIACVLVAVTLWGLFAAPKSATRLDAPLRSVFELSLFLLSAFLLYKLNHTSQAVLMAALSLLSVGMAYGLKQ
jgi:hypothetical protein